MTAGIAVPIRAGCYQQGQSQETQEQLHRGCAAPNSLQGNQREQLPNTASPRARQLSQDPTLHHSGICSTAGWLFKALHILFTFKNNISSSAFIQVYVAS